MRDINRIEPLLNQLEMLWKLYPDLRFCQLVYIITKGKNIFNIEDDKMLETIKNNIKISKEKSSKSIK